MFVGICQFPASFDGGGHVQTDTDHAAGAGVFLINVKPATRWCGNQAGFVAHAPAVHHLRNVFFLTPLRFRNQSRRDAEAQQFFIRVPFLDGSFKCFRHFGIHLQQLLVIEHQPAFGVIHFQPGWHGVGSLTQTHIGNPGLLPGSIQRFTLTDHFGDVHAHSGHPARRGAGLIQVGPVTIGQALQLRAIGGTALIQPLIDPCLLLGGRCSCGPARLCGVPELLFKCLPQHHAFLALRIHLFHATVVDHHAILLVKQLDGCRHFVNGFTQVQVGGFVILASLFNTQCRTSHQDSERDRCDHERTRHDHNQHRTCCTSPSQGQFSQCDFTHHYSSQQRPKPPHAGGARELNQVFHGRANLKDFPAVAGYPWCNDGRTGLTVHTRSG